MPTPTSRLLDLHLRSMARFLQAGEDPLERRDEGLQGALRAVFPVRSRDELASLEYVGYALEPPRFDEAECLHRAMTFAAPIKVTVRLIVWDPPGEHGDPRMIRDIKEQECYFGEVPLMTARGTFIVAGRERVCVPTLRPRSGVRRERSEGAAAVEFRDVYGDALTFERRGGAITARVCLAPHTPPGLVLRERTSTRSVHLTADGAFAPFDEAPRAAPAAPWDVHAPDGRVVALKGEKINARRRALLRDAGCPGVPLSPRDLKRYRGAGEVRSPDGSLLLGRDRPLNTALVRRLVAAGVATVAVYLGDEEPTPPEPAVVADADAALAWTSERFSSFDLGESGRAVADEVLGLSSPQGCTALTGQDLAAAFAWLGEPTDGDAPRYTKAAAGEQLAERALRGLWAVARAARLRMDACEEVETLMPHDLLNAAPLMRAFHAWLGAACSPLEETNPLAVVRHLRRVEGAEQPWPLAETLCRAAPLVNPEAPRSCSGVEAEVARAAGAVILAERDGRVAVVDDRMVLVLPDDPSAEVQVCPLRTERATRSDGARVVAGDVVAEGDGVKDGVLALGRHVRVAFSAELAEGEARVAERVAREGWFTSRSRPTHTIELRDTSLGPERFTATPPGVTGPEARHLDASGVAGVGAALRSGDVLVGKQTPSPDGGWRDASLRASEDAATVRDVAIFERRGRELSPRSESLREAGRARWTRVEEVARAAMAPEASGALETLLERCRRQIDRTYRGDDLPPGVIAVVRVTLEVERELGLGDRLADRHGLVAEVRAFTRDDQMPTLPDGTIADVLLPAHALPSGTIAEAAAGELYLVRLSAGS
jgi:DNA-directed RNA polymerase beta subunit